MYDSYSNVSKRTVSSGSVVDCLGNEALRWQPLLIEERERELFATTYRNRMHTTEDT